MCEDLGNDEMDDVDRKYITFVGPPVPAKGPDIFLKLVDYYNGDKSNFNFKFLLISRKKLSGEKFQMSNLKIFHKEKITDEEIGECFKKSLLTITPYTRATQSSVVLVSYMYGTPVLSSNIDGLRECIDHKKTGYLVELNENIKEWGRGIEYIINNNKELSRNCRKYFVNNFSESNWSKIIPKLLD